MPDNPTDSTTVVVPLPGGGVPRNGEEDMALTVSGGTIEHAQDVPAGVQNQALSRLSSAGATAHEHFIQFGKILDYAYEADRKMVSLVQSLGVREVTSRSGQAGVPKAGAEADAVAGKP